MSASLAPECNEIKESVEVLANKRRPINVQRKYDSCFYKWYSEKYLRGNSKDDDCVDLFNKYQSCLTKALRERGIDKMLEEARKDNKENDALHLRKS